MTFFSCVHIIEIPSILSYLDRKDTPLLKIIQYATTAIIASAGFYFNKFSPKKAFKIALFFILVIYIVIATSLFIYNLFDNTFAITLYW